MGRKLSDLFGGGLQHKSFLNKDVKDNEEVFGKDATKSGLVAAVDHFNKVSLKDYLVEYKNKEGDVIIHVFSKRKWPGDFLDKIKNKLEASGDIYECDFIIEVNSWFIKIKNFSVRRFGNEADAAFISSLLDDI